MASDNITLRISAKDLASVVLNKVGGEAGKLGDKVDQVSRQMSMAGRAAGAFGAGSVALGNILSSAVIGVMNGATKALGWFASGAMEAEAANVKLDAALRGLGQYTPAMSKQYQQLASAIQDETGASDEAVKANIGMLATLGVMPGQMAVAARWTEALGALNIEGATASRMVSKALQGNFEAFTKVVPGIKDAATESEKFSIVEQTLTAAMEQQKANLQTVGGAWAALKGRVGDVAEDIGMAAMKGLGLGGAFNSASQAIKDFAASSGFKDFLAGVERAGAIVANIGKGLQADGGFSATMKEVGDVILAAFQDGAMFAAEKLVKALQLFTPGGAGRFAGAMSGGATVSDALDQALTWKIPKAASQLSAAVDRLTRNAAARAASVGGARETTRTEDFNAYLQKNREARAMAGISDKARFEDEMKRQDERQKAIAAEEIRYREQRLDALKSSADSMREQAKAAAEAADLAFREWADPELYQANKQAREKASALEEEFQKKAQQLKETGGIYGGAFSGTFFSGNQEEAQKVQAVLTAREKKAEADKALADVAKNTAETVAEIKLLNESLKAATELG
jgi:DNA segregation ATPase FtsK/SpoIIIE-like protein